MLQMGLDSYKEKLYRAVSFSIIASFFFFGAPRP